jgi:hypothetical protein
MRLSPEQEGDTVGPLSIILCILAVRVQGRVSAPNGSRPRYTGTKCNGNQRKVEIDVMKSIHQVLLTTPCTRPFNRVRISTRARWFWLCDNNL